MRTLLSFESDAPRGGRLAGAAALLLFGCLAACSSADGGAAITESSAATEGTARDTPTDAEFQARVVKGLHDSILGDVDTMTTALEELQAAAPAPEGRGWDPVEDADAIAKMRGAWVRAREAYERVEGVVAPIFPYIDTPLDDRYEGFLAHLGATGGDPYLFDGKGVTGMHAIERILYVDVTPPRIVQGESTLPGYKAAAFPATAQEAADFKNLLLGRALQDAALLHREWDAAQFDASLAFQGLIDLMTEQREKVNKAASNEEESRYSQRTMADLRQNLVGTQRAYELFAPWLVTKPAPAGGGRSGVQVDADIRAGLANLGEGYDRVPGSSIPQPPDTWSANPSPADLATPFGKLYTLVRTSVNPNVEGSVVTNMDAASSLLNFPQQ